MPAQTKLVGIVALTKIIPNPFPHLSATNQLIQDVSEINAQSGILNSLDAKLESAFEALDDVNDNNDISAVNKLQAFINSVEAQRGNQISEVEADSLITAAQEIIDMLSVQ